MTSRRQPQMAAPPNRAFEHDGLFLYYPRRGSLAPKLRAFIDVAKKTLESVE
jgi:DNA-binding transcriptional LysR family regulator